MYLEHHMQVRGTENMPPEGVHHVTYWAIAWDRVGHGAESSTQNDWEIRRVQDVLHNGSEEKRSVVLGVEAASTIWGPALRVLHAKH